MKTMHRVTRLLYGFAFAIACTAVPLAAAADWPEREISFMVQFAPGGSTDLVARALNTEISKTLGTPMIVLNRPGAQATLMVAQLARQAPDGYHIGVLSTVSFAVSPLLMNVPYTLKDFTVIASIGRYAYAVVVNADSPYNTVEDLIAAAKKGKGLFFGTPGTINSIGMLLLAQKTGGKFEAVNYKSGTESIVALMGKQVDVAMPNPSDFVSLVKSGKLRALAVAGETRLRELPTTPTLRELGYDVVLDAYFGIGAPANLPEPIRAKIESAALKAARDPGFQSYIHDSLGIEPAPLTGEQYRVIIENTQQAMAKYKGQFSPPAN